MASQIKVDQLAGAAGNTVTVPAGQTLDVLGTLDIDGGTLVLPNTVVTTTGTQTLTNKTINASQLVDSSVATGKVADNAITLAKMASGTDGNIISYDASGNPVAVATGSSGQVLTSAGAGAVPSFQAVSGGDVTLNGTQTLTNKTLTAPKIGTSILDTNGNELALLTATGSAVNEFTIANAASGGGPRLSATGETNVDLDLLAKGTGHVTVRGNNNSGAVQFNCELNSHGQIVIAQPHSAGVTNTLTLPAGASSTLVSLVSTDTLTNKTLTSPKIGTSILDTNGNELFKLTATGSAVNELTYANAATGNKPAFTATGGDTNIGVSIQPKGSGTVTIDALTFPAADGSADQVLKTDGSGTLSFTDVSGGTSWQAVKTSGFTAVAGEGYFINTTGGTITMTLPSSPSIGDEVSFVDYAGTFDSNTMTVGRNSQKINGATADLTVSVERAANTLVYTDGTQGWLLKNK